MNYFYDKYQKKFTKKGIVTVISLIILLLLFLLVILLPKHEPHIKVHKQITQKKKNNNKYLDTAFITEKEKNIKNDEELFNTYAKTFDKKFIKTYKEKESKYCNDTQGVYNTDKEAKILDLNHDGIICDGNTTQKNHEEKLAKLVDVKDIHKIDDIKKQDLVVNEPVKEAIISTPTIPNNVQQPTQQIITPIINNVKPSKKPQQQTSIHITQQLTINNSIQSSYSIESTTTHNIIIKEGNSDITFDLEPGTYEIKQIKIMDGYIINTEVKSITIKDANTNVQFINKTVVENDKNTLKTKLEELIKTSNLTPEDKFIAHKLIKENKTLDLKDLIIQIQHIIVKDNMLNEKIKYLSRKF